MDFVKPALKKYPEIMAMIEKSFNEKLKDNSSICKLKQTDGTRTYIPVVFEGNLDMPIIQGAVKQNYPQFKEIVLNYSASQNLTYFYLYLT